MIANAGVAINRILHESACLETWGSTVDDADVSFAAPTEELDRLLNINVKGTFFSYKYAAIQLIKQGTGGRILGAASIASKKGKPRTIADSNKY